MEILTNEQLKNYTAFRIGGTVAYLCKVTSAEDLKEVQKLAKEKELPITVIGGGTNILAADEPIARIVVRVEDTHIEWQKEDESALVISGAGVLWDDLVAETVRAGYQGLETLSLIPGTVGASPVQNIGAYGTEVSQYIEWVEVFDFATSEIHRLTNNECKFGYRNSIFKQAEGKDLLVMKVAFRLTTGGLPNISYKDVAAYFESHDIEPTLENVRQAVIEIRTNKLPDVSKVGSAGSFFKNPIISAEQFENIKMQYPDMPSYPAENGYVKVPAGWLIDTVCHLKGFREGNVGVHDKQALVLVNYGGGTAKEIHALADKIISCVKEKTGIVLEPEVVEIF